MKKNGLMIALSLMVSSIVFAGPGGQGVGHGQGHGNFSASSPSAMPPGLQQKGSMPHGLQKQGKTPRGWSKGKKRGWRLHRNRRSAAVRHPA